MEEIGASKQHVGRIIGRLYDNATAGARGDLYVSARFFWHIYITECDGSRACEVRLVRKKHTRGFVAKLVIYVPPSATDPRPLASFGDLSKTTARQW